MTFFKQIGDDLGVVTTAALKAKGCLRHTFQVKRTAGADRTVKVLISINDIQWFDAALTFTFDSDNVAMATLERVVSSIKIDVSGGSTGTYDVWWAGSDS